MNALPCARSGSFSACRDEEASAGFESGWRVRHCVAGDVITTGTGSGDIGAWPVRRAVYEEEFCMLLDGDVALTDALGHRRTFHAGESFVVPAGFLGTWENLTPVLKYFSTTRRPATLPGMA